MSNNTVITQIRENLDIADIIGEKVKLRPSSRGWMGLCPFHQENTPSFHVYSDTQSYYCFGCHASGDIFTYVMQYEGLSFPDALKILADRAGVKLDNYHPENRDAYSVMDLAAKFFTDNIMSNSGTAARAYMSRRKFTTNDLQRYSIGYSPNAWDALTRYLRDKGIQDKTILDSGLALTGKYGLYDRFRGRVIFPIHDITGKVIAFGGRLIDGEGAKYINSPESSLYRKRNNLYLMDIARKSIRQKGRSILVEGYMDALRLHMSGFTESAASLGTSLTPEQAAILSRYADTCYICYDSDTAGQAATVKGMYTLAEHGLRVYVVYIPQGKDPDEFLSNNPPEKFEELLSSASPLILMHVNSLKPALQNEKTRRKALTALFEGLSRLSLDYVTQYMGSICTATALSPEIVQNYLLKKDTLNSENARITITPPKIYAANPYDELEAALCVLLMRSQECRSIHSLDELMSILRNETARDIAATIFTENTDGLYELWLSTGDTKKISLLKMGENFCAQMPLCASDTERFTKVYSSLKRGSIERRIAELKAMPQDKQIVDELFTLFRQRLLYPK